MSKGIGEKAKKSKVDGPLGIVESMIGDSEIVHDPRLGWLDKLIMAIFFTTCVIGILFFFLVKTVSVDDTKIKSLENYNPQETTIVYDKDGGVIGEISKERRIFVTFDKIPEVLKQAIISAEDKTFYTNSGIDFFGLFRAVVKNTIVIATGKKDRLMGASTITQQVVKNVLLTNERTLTRKFREMVLSLKITKLLPKEKIFEIYLNHIYFGMHAYGVASAAKIYFDKNLEELNLAEVAMLAALPRAPSSLNPIKNPKAALKRRNWVLQRMVSEGFIKDEECRDAIAMPIETKRQENSSFAWAFMEYIKSNVEKAGITLEQLQVGGYRIHTTLNKKWQDIAQEQFDKGMIEYSKRHGFRGPIAKVEVDKDFKDTWRNSLLTVPRPSKIAKLSMAIVLGIKENSPEDMVVKIGFPDGTNGFIDFEDMSWARGFISAVKIGPVPTKPSDILSVGDVIVVDHVYAKGKTNYSLEQIPELNGGVLIMSPKNGEIYTMVGGYADVPATFNRATQAKRQAGSVIKPFIYLAGLEKGIKPNDIFVDSDISFNAGDGEVWNPQNHSKMHFGAVTMRTGLEQSLNVVTIRVANEVSLRNLMKMFKKFDLFYNYPNNLSIALGSGETTLMKVARAYSIIANGGNIVTPKSITSMTSRSSEEILSENIENKEEVSVGESEESTEDVLQEDSDEGIVKYLNNHDGEEKNQTLASPQSVYQVINLMKGVVGNGAAGRRSQSIKDVNFAGKTGTSQEGRDLWFAGFTPDVVIVVYAGFDVPETTGNEYGSMVALPIFVNIMQRIKNDIPKRDFDIPEGVKFVKINKTTGAKASTDSEDVIYEVFKESDVIEEERVKEKEVGEGIFEENTIY